MNDPYVTFDTFTVGAEFDTAGLSPARPTPTGPSANLPSILARLPRVAPAAPAARPIQRIDDPAPAVPVAHLAEAAHRYGESLPDTMAPARTALLADPVATIRIDTVSPNSYAEPSPGVAPRPLRAAAAPSPSVVAQAPAAPAIDDPWSAWLLNLESTVQPYSRWIALAAVVAALGLTVVLLRTGAASRTADPAPLVNSEPTAEPLAEAAPAAEAPSWPAPAPVETPTPAPRFAPARAVAAGPASAIRRSAQATLTGEVLAPDAQRVDVASVPAGPAYPSTTR